MATSNRRLLIGRTVAALATALIPMTLTLALVRTGSAGDLGLVLASEVVPMLALLPVAGVVADRFPPQRTVLTADLVRAAAQLGIGAELLGGSPRVADLAVLAAVTGAAVAFGQPAVRTLVAGVVESSERLRVNTRLGVGQALAQVVGPAVAGALMLLVGAGWSSLLTGALFVVSATTLGGLRPRPAPDRPRRAPFFAELAEGWTETRRHPWFLANVLGHGAIHLSMGLVLTLGPLIAVRSLGGEASWVVIAQVATVGLVAGVFAAPRLPIRHPLVGVALGAAAYAVPMVAFALKLPMPVIVVTYSLAAFGIGLLGPLWETTLQRRIPSAVLGRVASLDTMISTVARPVGLAVAAPLAALVGTGVPLLAGAVLVAGTNLVILLLPDVREAPAVLAPGEGRAVQQA
ncbi:MFS transporter [Kitasatospora sp. NPDC094015]|uniref:MFS transporter n=1 Tax=Kitasatospora sp. NPDC094015 TaxID=3155205 RepID=UPI0033261B21